MKSVVLSKPLSGHHKLSRATITLDQIPTDAQAGDVIQVVSPSGQVRGVDGRLFWFSFLFFCAGFIVGMLLGFVAMID